MADENINNNAIKGISYRDMISQIVALINQSPNEYIETRLEKILNEYLSLISSGIYFKVDKSFYIPFDNENGKQNGISHIVKSCIEYAKNIIKNYLEGNFKKCNKLSGDWWYEETKYGKRALPVVQITPVETFYRIRLQENEFKGFTRKDLFHVPFERRGYISTNRYSVLGYPCLYLGRSIYTCWEEAHRPKLDTFFVSAFKSIQTEIKLLDFRLIRDDFPSYWEFRKYICVLPMIIGCSLRVNMSNEKFRAEYILPQVILHQIITSKLMRTHWEGVMFTSTQVEDDFNFTKDNPSLADNIAVPIQVNAQSGWCEKLCTKFELTEPTNYEYELIKQPIKLSQTDIEITKDGTLSLGSVKSPEEGLSPFALMEMRLGKREFRCIDSKTGESINEDGTS